MSVIQTPSRVANAAISIDLCNEKTSEPFHISTEVSDLTLDGNTVLCVSQATTAAYLALDNEKAPIVSQTPIEADLTQDDSSTVTEISRKILGVIFEYALNKFDDMSERHAAGAPKFLSIITGFVREGKQLQMCLPAFPFKSANKVYKVLGTLPDKAEELALSRLNSMCTSIGDFYLPGAKLTIISDGLVYNGLCN